MNFLFFPADGKTTSRHFAGQEQQHAHHHDHSQGSEIDASSQNRHNLMLAAIEECEVLVSGGMGTGAYLSMQSATIKLHITDYNQINDALQAYPDGILVDRREKLH